MNEMQIETRALFESRNMNLRWRATVENGRRLATGVLFWYLAQPALPEVKYALTSNGYVTLP